LDDGILAACEVAQPKLNTDRVVLSASNTTAGDKPGPRRCPGSHVRPSTAWISQAAARLTTSTFEALAKDPKFGRAEARRRALHPWNAHPDYWTLSIVGEGGR
jgi:hypothetical protein